MVAVPDLTEEECYLLAILQDQSGIDAAELCWVDESSPDSLFRCYDYQVAWFRDDSKFQIDQSGRSLGKALDVLTPVPAPGGWTTMGDLRVGDLIYGSDGRPVRVLEAYDWLENRPCYEVEFDTGNVIVADADHLWTVRRLDLADRRLNTLTTKEMFGKEQLPGGKGFRYAVDVADPVSGLRCMKLPIPPWLLGYWLGDGDTRTGQITVGNEDIEDFLQKVVSLGYSATVRPPRKERTAHRVSLRGPDGTQFGRLLTAAGAKRPDRNDIPGRKSIPESYLVASIPDRIELIRGFMDADGTASGGRPAFNLMNEHLFGQLVQLVNSLGEKCFARFSNATLDGKVVGTRWRAGWTPNRFNPFWYERKASKVKFFKGRHKRSIKSIRKVDSRPVRCITVDSDDHLFLVGRGYIPTHNSLGIQMRSWAFPFTNAGQEMLITAPEMIHLDPVTKNIEDRLLSTRLTREFLDTTGNSKGFTHRPFEAKFRNGAKIIGRIPQKDGRGVKGSVSVDTLVLTDEGLVPAGDVTAGTMVLTELGRFRPVLHVYRYEADTVAVSGAGHRGLVVSENHRFFGRRAEPSKVLGSPTWVVVDNAELTERWYWASPMAFPEIPWDRIEIFDDFMEDGILRVPDHLSGLFELAGRYLAGGSIGMRDGHPIRVMFTDDDAGISAITKLAEKNGFNARRVSHQNAPRVDITNAQLCRWLVENFGRLSHGKRIPGWALGIPDYLRRSLLDGYLSGDGYWHASKNRWEASSASKDLAIGVKLLGQSLGYATSFSWTDPKVEFISGVRLKNPPKRSFRVHLKDPDVSANVIDHDFQWGRVKRVEPAGRREVVDLVVAEDFSYIGDGVVHRGSAFLPNGDKAD